MQISSVKIFTCSAALSVFIILLHWLTLWLAPFASLYQTTPAMLVLVAFLAVFLFFAGFVIARSARNDMGVPASPDLLGRVFGDRRLLVFLLLTSLVGIALHVWSKHYLTGLRPITCISEIRFAWLEVDRSLLPFYIRLASMLGHLLTSFAYLGMLSISYTMTRAGSVKAVSRSDILLQMFFALVGVIYAGFIGSRNALLAFLCMNVVGLILGLAYPGAGEKVVRRLRLGLFVLAIPTIGMVAFSSAIFSDRLFCNKPEALVQVESDVLSARKTVLQHMAGNNKEFGLKARELGNDSGWRETLFLQKCSVCGPSMVYLNHGIFNLSKVMAADERGDPMLLNFIAAWGGRIGLNVGMQGKTGARVYGPGGITLAGAAYHDYGFAGLVLTAAALGLLFAKSIQWMQSTGVRVFVGVWLFSCLFYILFLSTMFVGLSLLPFPFIAFGIGVGLLVWVLISRMLIKRC